MKEWSGMEKTAFRERTRFRGKTKLIIELSELLRYPEQLLERRVQFEGQSQIKLIEIVPQFLDLIALFGHIVGSVQRVLYQEQLVRVAVFGLVGNYGRFSDVLGAFLGRNTQVFVVQFIVEFEETAQQLPQISFSARLGLQFVLEKPSDHQEETIGGKTALFSQPCKDRSSLLGAGAF